MIFKFATMMFACLITGNLLLPAVATPLDAESDQAKVEHSQVTAPQSTSTLRPSKLHGHIKKQYAQTAADTNIDKDAPINHQLHAISGNAR